MLLRRLIRVSLSVPYFFPFISFPYLFPASVQAGVNPIPILNNSFEQTDKDAKFPTDWSCDQKDKFRLDEDAKDGKRSLHLEDWNQAWPNAYQILNGVPEGGEISAGLWVRTKDINKDDNDASKIFHVYLKFTPLDGNTSQVDLVQLSGTNGWKWYLKKKIKVPTGLKEVRLVYAFDGVDGQAWVDRIVLVKGTELPPETISTSEEVGNRAEVLKAAIARSRAAIKKQTIDAGPRQALSEARAKIVTATLLARQLEEDAAVSSTLTEGRTNGPEKAAAMRRAAATVKAKVADAVRLIEEAEAAQERETPSKAEEISAAKAAEALQAIQDAETASEAAETAATESKVVMATWGGGIFSTSSASKWEESNADDPHHYANFIVADVDGKLYCGGADKYLYDSDDNGKTWSVTPTKVPVVPTGFALDPDAPEHWGLVSWGQGAWFSEDAGRNWKPWVTPTPFLRRLTRLNGAYYAIGDDQTVLTATALNGEWHPVATLPRGIKGWDIAIKPGREHTLLVATDAGVAEIGKDGTAAFPKLEISSAWARSLTVDLDRVLIGTWGRGVIEWTPGASSTPYSKLINDGLNNNNVFALTVSLNPKPDLTAGAGTAEGPHIWTDRNGGIGGFSINGLVANPKDEKEMYCSSQNGVYHSTDQGANWVKTGDMTAPNVGTLAIDPNNPNTLFAAAAYYNIASGIQKTTDGGKTWNQTLNGIKTMYVGLDHGNPNTVYTISYGGGASRSDDGGQNWVDDNVGLPSNIGYAIVVGAQDPHLVFACLLGKGLSRYDDANKTWVDANRGLNATDIWHIAQDPNDGNTWLVGTAGGGLYKSTDGGKNWRQITKGLNINGIYRVVYDPHKAGVVYVGGKAVNFGGSGGGVYRSADGGESWAPDNEGLDNLNITDMYITGSGLVYVSTSSGVFYKQD